LCSLRAFALPRFVAIRRFQRAVGDLALAGKQFDLQGVLNALELTMIQAISELQKLPLHERLQLVEDLWDSIALEDINLDVPQWQQDELDRRDEEFRKNINLGIPWSVAKDLIRGRHDV